MNNGPNTPAPGVTASFWGTNSLVLRDGKTTLLVDPYFTRVSKWAMLLKKAASDPAASARALKQAGVDQAAAILITHTHFDHVLDAAEVARLTGAVVCGSESTANVCRGGGLPGEQICVAAPDKPLVFGDFTVSFLPGVHLSFPPLLAKFFGPGKTVDGPLVPPARAKAYAEGGVFTLLFEHPAGSFINQGSANWVEGALQHLSVDAALLGVGGLDLHGPDYWDAWLKETVDAAGPNKIYWTHWDDFCLPLDRPPVIMPQCRKVMPYLEARAREPGSPFMEKAPWRQSFQLL